MRIIRLTMLLTLAAVLPVFAGTVPSVTTQVNVTGGSKEYAYAMTNDLDSGNPISQFVVFMPELAARIVTSFTSSKAGWVSHYSFRGDISAWSMYAISSAELMPGEHITFTLFTPSEVATSYSYKPGTYPSNWKWVDTGGDSFGDQSMPVPVPEPTSLLALGLAASGLGGFVLRRRRR